MLHAGLYNYYSDLMNIIYGFAIKSEINLEGAKESTIEKIIELYEGVDYLNLNDFTEFEPERLLMVVEQGDLVTAKNIQLKCFISAYILSRLFYTGTILGKPDKICEKLSLNPEDVMYVINHISKLISDIYMDPDFYTNENPSIRLTPMTNNIRGYVLYLKGL